MSDSLNNSRPPERRAVPNTRRDPLSSPSGNLPPRRGSNPLDKRRSQEENKEAPSSPPQRQSRRDVPNFPSQQQREQAQNPPQQRNAQAPPQQPQRPAPAAPQVPQPQQQQAPQQQSQSPAQQQGQEAPVKTGIVEEQVKTNIDEILRVAVDRGVSDIHLSVNTPPMYRIDGDISAIPEFEKVIDNEWMESTAQHVMTEVQYRDFLELHEMDLSYKLDGTRFRVNCFFQRGFISAVFRVIPERVKALAELGVPEVVYRITEEKRGLVLVTGPTGSGKALRLDTKIPTPDGWTTMGALKVHDKVIDSQGNPANVIGLSDINEKPELFKITLSDGQEIFADKDHQWIVATHESRNMARHPKEVKTLKNSQAGTEAGDNLITLSSQYSGEETLKGAFDIIVNNGVSGYFPSPYSIRQSLDFMDVEVFGGNGVTPITFDVSEALSALGHRLLQRYSRDVKPIFKVMSTKEMIAEGLKDSQDRTNFSIHTASFEGSEKDLPIDPYVLGVWLGDGFTDGGRIVSGKEDCEELVTHLQKGWGNEIVATEYEDSYNITLKGAEDYSGDSLHSVLNKNGFLGDKHISSLYLRASFEQRLSLLQGLIDSDGSVNEQGLVEITLSNEKLAYDSLELVRSLGIKTKINKTKSGYTDDNGNYVPCKDRYRIAFSTNLPVSRLNRKRSNIDEDKQPEGRKWLYVNSIEEVDENDENYGPVRCISVDSPDKSYLCGDYVVTHNSTTLAAMVDSINDSRPDHIITVEDPIEFVHNNKKSLVNQREVGSDTKNFSEALKRLLRQDPDVILIGELRDPETIETALTAAETGHLVFGTLHTQSADKTITRIIDSFPHEAQEQVKAQLSGTLQAVISQTLLKKRGGGRVMASEIMVRTDAIANNIKEGNTSSIYDAISTGKVKYGMRTLDQNLVDLVSQGIIGYEEAASHMRYPNNLDSVTPKDSQSDSEWDF